MMDIIRKIIKPKYESLNRIEIDASKIISNFNYLKNIHQDKEIFPVLKANAYGHGLREIAKILNYTSAKMVAVDSYPEAQIVYRYFKGKVIIIGEMPQKAYQYCKLSRTEFIVYNDETLRYLSRYKKKARVHLFINTGMNREGINNIDAFLKENKEYLDKVEVSGICSHFLAADSRSLKNSTQEEVFVEALKKVNEAGYYPKWVHTDNSAAVFWSDNKSLTSCRPGLALYGYDPLNYDDPAVSNLKPALDVYSQIISIQEVKAGDAVSYGDDFKVNHDSQIAVIPFGYFEGLDRRLSNQAEFRIYCNGNIYARVAGTICMNLTCLDAGKENIQVGDEVQIVSSNKDDLNSVENIASMMETITYEFLVKLQPSIRRTIINLPKVKEKNA